MVWESTKEGGKGKQHLIDMTCLLSCVKQLLYFTKLSHTRSSVLFQKLQLASPEQVT